MIRFPHTEALKTIGKIGEIRAEIEAVQAGLEAVPSWRPGRALKLQCHEALGIIDNLSSRFERKLVVTLIGPSGSGKSTLLNALAGVDHLSPAGNQRPTTRQVIVFSQAPEDAAGVSAELGGTAVEIRTDPRAETLEHVLLIDTPDTDSMEQEKHIPIIRKAVALSDVLICVFNGENPKTRDHVEFMSSFVRRFSGGSLIGVLNKCDRLDEKELTDTILPEFKHYLKVAWNMEVGRIVCISARRHLSEPDWDDRALPKHGFDEFQSLRQMVFQTFNRPGYIVDRRLENALALRDYIREAVRGELDRDKGSLEGLREEIAQMERKALGRAAERLQSEDALKPAGINALIYQKLAQRWTGPVGWLIALWARILVLGSGIASLVRFTSFRRWLNLSGSEGGAGDGISFPEGIAAAKGMETAMRHYRLALMEEWPALAERLVKSRFDVSVRKLEMILSDSETFNHEIASVWQGAMENALENAVRKMSHYTLQLLLNLPVIGILVHMAWVGGWNYFTGNYLETNFFVHAILITLILLLLVFFIFQMISRFLASPDRITRLAFSALGTGFAHLQPLSSTPLVRQLEALLALEESLEPVA